MKTNKRIVIYIAFTFGVIFTAVSQRGLDSLVVSINPDIQINMTIYSYKNLSNDVELDLKNLQEILKGTPIAYNSSYTIQYDTDQQMSIKPKPTTETIVWKDDKIKRTTFENLCMVNRNTDLEDKKRSNYVMQIHFNELDSLLSSELPVKMKQVIDSLQIIENRSSKVYDFSFEQSVMNVNSSIYKRSRYSADYLSYDIGIGVNLIKNIIVPELYMEVAYSRDYKGISRDRFSLTLSALSYFENTTKGFENSFLTIGYERNISNTIGKDQFIGLSFGYLIERKGDLFDKNTFKVGTMWQLSKNVTISPQLYFSKNEIYPAIRLAFGF